jgi:hypothetical protein
MLFITSDAAPVRTCGKTSGREQERLVEGAARDDGPSHSEAHGEDKTFAPAPGELSTIMGFGYVLLH